MDLAFEASAMDAGGGALATKLQIVAAGERMLGEEGIDRVPLHEIAVAAGQANKSAVQYHFRDREGLIAAIFAARYSRIVERNRELIYQSTAAQLDEPRRLLELIFMPIAEQVDDRGTHSYARFLMQYVTRPRFDHRRTPLGSSDDPVDFVYQKLALRCGLSEDELLRRLYPLTLLFLGALIEHDNAQRLGREASSIENVVSTSLRMMTAALLA